MKTPLSIVELQREVLLQRQSNIWRSAQIFFGLLFFISAVGCVWGQGRSHDYLVAAEIDALREAQDINERVPLYLNFAKARVILARRLAGLEIQEKTHQKPRKGKTPPPPSTTANKTEPELSLADVLSEYKEIYTEMLRNLDQRLDQGVDARKALKAILKESPLHRSNLKEIEAKLGEEAPDVLSTALSDTSDAIEGSQKALSNQEEKFKEEKKRTKEKSRDSRN